MKMGLVPLMGSRLYLATREYGQGQAGEDITGDLCGVPTNNTNKQHCHGPVFTSTSIVYRYSYPSYFCAQGSVNAKRLRGRSSPLAAVLICYFNVSPLVQNDSLLQWRVVSYLGRRENGR